MKYFTVEELIKSETAIAKGINNEPNDDVKRNIVWFINNTLDPLREDWGAPIVVRSGYRCKQLNAAVKGSKTSTHMTGFAADIQTKDMKKFYAFCREYYKHHEFDQCIKEPGWIHISAFPEQNRNMFLQTSDGKNYRAWLRE